MANAKSKSKSKTVYACQNCGAQRARWEGHCSDCGSWNSFVEETYSSSPTVGRGWVASSSAEALTLDQSPGEIQLHRWSTGLAELDRVLGGGLVRGSFVLLGGAPGIGKSTLLMQMAGGLSTAVGKILYASAEESVEQTAHRARRFGIRSKNITVINESRMENIIAYCEKESPDVLIVDSIQTVYLEDLESAPGSVSQVRESAARLLNLAKARGIAVFLIGHITKDGNLAGPKVLEHMVDCVLAFEGESTQQYRLLRALKNRFGAAHELGVFTMGSMGLREVTNPSELFLEERRDSVLGSAVYASMEGSRPLLCEIQALTVSTPLAMPRRTTLGIEVNRLHMLLAVLDRHLDRSFSDVDVYVNVVGGLRLEEPACDLAILASLLSTESRQEIPPQAVFFGEVGLTGEIRATAFAEQRVKEAAKLGFKKVFLPAANRRQMEDLSREVGCELHWVDHIRALPRMIFSTSLSAPTRKKGSPAKGANHRPIIQGENRVHE